jgi:hypothetical protein
LLDVISDVLLLLWKNSDVLGVAWGCAQVCGVLELVLSNALLTPSWGAPHLVDGLVLQQLWCCQH